MLVILPVDAVVIARCLSRTAMGAQVASFCPACNRGPNDQPLGVDRRRKETSEVRNERTGPPSRVTSAAEDAVDTARLVCGVNKPLHFCKELRRQAGRFAPSEIFANQVAVGASWTRLGTREPTDAIREAEEKMGNYRTTRLCFAMRS
jgi:hypothetical protein